MSGFVKSYQVRQNACRDGWDVFRPTGGLLGTWVFERDAMNAAVAERDAKHPSLPVIAVVPFSS